MLIIIFFAIATAKYIVSAIYIHSRHLKPRLPGAMQLRTRGHDSELPTIRPKYEFNKGNFILRSLFTACAMLALQALY